MTSRGVASPTAIATDRCAAEGVWVSELFVRLRSPSKKTGGSRFLELKNVITDRLVPVCFFAGRPHRQTLCTREGRTPSHVARFFIQAGGDQPAVRHFLLAGKG
jgi:hypothetical protein